MNSTLPQKAAPTKSTFQPLEVKGGKDPKIGYKLYSPMGDKRVNRKPIWAVVKQIQTKTIKALAQSEKDLAAELKVRAKW